MTEKNINSRIQQKHDIESNWLKAINFIPKQGELIVYDIDENHDYERIKIGDGVNIVSNLPFIDDNKANKTDIVQADWSQNDETALDYVKNRTHWETPILTTVVPEMVVSASDEVEVDNLLNTYDTYVVTIDGVSYTCKSFFNAFDEPSLGDSRLYDNDMSNPMDVPFYVSSYVGGFSGEIYQVSFLFLDSNVHTVKIMGVTSQTEVHHLDEKFIPDTIARKSEIIDLDLITVEDIDTICGGAISYADGVTF